MSNDCRFLRRILDTSDNRKELSPEGRIPPESIDTILVKGTFDVMCCGENYEHHIVSYVNL